MMEGESRNWDPLYVWNGENVRLATEISPLVRDRVNVSRFGYCAENKTPRVAVAENE